MSVVVRNLFPLDGIIRNGVEFIGEGLRSHVVNVQYLAGICRLRKGIRTKGNGIVSAEIENIHDLVAVVFNGNRSGNRLKRTVELAGIVRGLNGAVIDNSDTGGAFGNGGILADRAVIRTAVNDTIVDTGDTAAILTNDIRTAAAAGDSAFILSGDTTADGAVDSGVEAGQTAFFAVDGFDKSLGLGIDTADTMVDQTFIDGSDTAGAGGTDLEITVDHG